VNPASDPGTAPIPDAESAALLRSQARDIFLAALKKSSIARAFQQNLEYSRGVLRIVEDVYDVHAYSSIQTIAMGKAARPMAEALQQQLGSLVKGILVTPEVAAAQESSLPMLHGFRHFSGGHPLPTENSMRAAHAILNTLHNHSQHALVIYLISGGASAMVEAPLHDAITLEDLVLTYRALVHCGAPIVEINAIRKHLSAVKGGRLTLAANSGGAKQQLSIMVSDVPEHALEALASGPTMPDRTTTEECYAIARKYQLLAALPPAVRRLFEQRALQETPKADDGDFHASRWWPVLSNESLQKAAGEAARNAGCTVVVDNACDDWDYARAADYLLERLRSLRQSQTRVCLLSGGEVTVKVPAGCGVGGRNQQFALYCASKIANENITVLSAGSDGIDGNSPAAGAVADGTTLVRARERGIDAALALEQLDAFPLFQALGDAIVIGPTGNNIRDLRILLAF
jgi:glycerate 2-kinase